MAGFCSLVAIVSENTLNSYNFGLSHTSYCIVSLLISQCTSGSHGLTDGSKAGDWRLPNVKELHSLIDFAYYGPALLNASGTSRWTEGNPFVGVQTSIYWSRTTYSGYSAVAWGVYLYGGYVGGGNKTGTGYVWPVRAGQ